METIIDDLEVGIVNDLDEICLFKEVSENGLSCRNAITSNGKLYFSSVYNEKSTKDYWNSEVHKFEFCFDEDNTKKLIKMATDNYSKSVEKTLLDMFSDKYGDSKLLHFCNTNNITYEIELNVHFSRKKQECNESWIRQS